MAAYCEIAASMVQIIFSFGSFEIRDIPSVQNTRKRSSKQFSKLFSKLFDAVWECFFDLDFSCKFSKLQHNSLAFVAGF